MEFKDLRVGFAMTGSFCTFKNAFKAAQDIVGLGCDVTPIMSFNAKSISSRFGTSEENIEKIESICGKKIICTIEGAEPIGPKKLLDVIVVAPCTGNTLAKLALGITDTPVTMAVKSHIRNSRPAIIAVGTNDALASSAKNIGMLMNYRNYYFVPFSQDSPEKKPRSMIAKYDMIPQTIECALNSQQIQPIVYF